MKSLWNQYINICMYRSNKYESNKILGINGKFVISEQMLLIKKNQM